MEHSAEIQALEKEVMEKQARLSELLREGPHDDVKDYVLKGAGGEDVRLSELFGDKPDLIVVHNMGRSCPYCTLWADGFNGVVEHLEDRASFVIVSPDDPKDQQAFAASRGWKMPMVSNGDSDFTKDMGFVGEHEGKPFPLPGVSTFRRQEDGTIARIAHDMFGPGDAFAGIWHLFGLLEGGAGMWQPKFSYR